VPEVNIIIPSFDDGLDAFHGSWTFRLWVSQLKIHYISQQNMHSVWYLHKQEIL